MGQQTLDEFVELSAPTGAGHADVPDVIIEVELGVLDEPRAVQPQRRTGHAIPQLRHLRETRGDEVADGIQREVRRFRGIADRQPAAMHMPAGRLGEPERCIDTGQPVHRISLKR